MNVMIACYVILFVRIEGEGRYDPARLIICMVLFRLRDDLMYAVYEWHCLYIYIYIYICCWGPLLSVRLA